MKCQLIYLAFGAEIYQQEAFFSIVSALRHIQSHDALEFDINVYTDNPTYFSPLSQVVTTHAIDKKWLGSDGYIFRMKPAMLSMAMEGHEKSILIDTDTIFKKPVKLLFSRVSDKQILVNNITQLASKLVPKKVYDAILQNGYPIADTKCVNSGVIGISQKNKEVVCKTLKAIDHLHPKCPQLTTLEELALALSANESNLAAVGCTDVIHHYWSKKAFYRKKIGLWLDLHRSSPLSKNALDDVVALTVNIPKPPMHIRLKQKMLLKLVSKENRHLLKEMLYASWDYTNKFDDAASQVWLERAVENMNKKGLEYVEIGKALEKVTNDRERCKIETLYREIKV